MKSQTNIVLLAGMLLFSAVLFSNFVFAQERSQTNVTEEYLSSVEDIIITELTAAPDRETKEIALDYLEAAIKDGRTSPDMQVALRNLAGEGVLKESRTNGRLMNNYPEVRSRACRLLGEVGDERATQTLTEIVIAENEPMVSKAAVKAFAKCNTEHPDEVIAAIAWAEKRYAVINPTSSLAYEILETYEKYAPNVSDNKEMIRSISEIAVNQYYTRSVREKAIKLLTNLKGM